MASGNKQPIKKTRPSTKSPLKKPHKAPVKKEKSLERKMYEKYLRSAQFREVKEIVHRRDHEKCTFCGRDAAECMEAKTTLQVHHTCYTALGKGGEEEAETCILACGICHRAAHRAPNNMRRFQDKSAILKNWKEINGEGSDE